MVFTSFRSQVKWSVTVLIRAIQLCCCRSNLNDDIIRSADCCVQWKVSTAHTACTWLTCWLLLAVLFEHPETTTWSPSYIDEIKVYKYFITTRQSKLLCVHVYIRQACLVNISLCRCQGGLKMSHCHGNRNMLISHESHIALA